MTDVFLGLFSTQKEELPTRCGQMSFLDHVVTNEYSEPVSRLTTSVDLGECTASAPRFRAAAIWDTGTSSSCISERFAREHDLHPVDTGVGYSASEPMPISWYVLDVYLSADIVIRGLRVAAFPLEKHNIDFLIGMDIISRGDLSVRNVHGKTVVSFEIR